MRGPLRKVFPASLRSLSSWMTLRDEGAPLPHPSDPSPRSGLDRYIAISLLIHLGVVSLLAFLPSQGPGLIERPPMSVHILKLTELEAPKREQTPERPRKEPRREARPSPVKPSPPKAKPPSLPEPFPLSEPKAIESPKATPPQAATRPHALTVEEKVDSQGTVKRAMKPFIPEVNPFLPQTLFSAAVPKAVQSPGAAQPAEIKKPALLPTTEAVEERRSSKAFLEALTIEGPSLRPRQLAAEQAGPKVVEGGRPAEVGHPVMPQSLARLDVREDQPVPRPSRDPGVKGLTATPVLPRQLISGEGVEGRPKAVEGKLGEEARRSTPAVIERLGAGEGKVGQKRSEVAAKGLEAPAVLQPTLSPQAGGEATPKAVGGRPGSAAAPGGRPAVARLGAGEKVVSPKRGEGGTGLEGTPGPGRPALSPKVGGEATPKAVGGRPGSAAAPGGPPAVTPLRAEGQGGSPRGGGDLSKAVLPGQGALRDIGGPQDVKIPERFLKAGRGSGESKRSGAGFIDTSDPDFTEYFETIKKRVYAAWKYPKGVRGEHKVSLRFSLDQAGGVHGVKVVDSTNRTLNESAVQAMERASPFPPIPEKFKKLVGEPLILIFTVIIQ